MLQLTELERKVLHAITKDCFYENGLESVIWADVFLDTCMHYGMESKVVRGTLSSLIKKEIIKPIMKGRDGTISFTEEGIELMKELGYEE